MNPIIIIPARMASIRLPNKPLVDIGGLPMIVHVWKRAVSALMGEVVVACDSRVIAQAIEDAGGKAVLTDPELPSGSDRIYAALCQIDPDKKYDVVVNVQGDMPTLDPKIIRQAVALLENPAVDIGTLAAKLGEGEAEDRAVVKVVCSWQLAVGSEKKHVVGRALSFSRSIQPIGEAYHHIGIYAYRREALERFVALPPSANEQREKLEQLRAMDAGMRLDVAVVDTVPLGVDTAEGLEKARMMIE